jgi:glycosyltransferase involved in cell wall biosynthesis
VVRAAVYNRFWPSQGGGERHVGKIAEALAADGAEVDVVGHDDVDLAELGDHIDVDFSGCRFRRVPDRGDTELARALAPYDLLVNGSYMSRLRPSNPRAVYLTYFPTPFDHDLPGWRRAAIRTLGPHLRETGEWVTFGLGWYPPEGGLRRSWTWTTDEAVLAVPPQGTGGRGVLLFDLGRPGAPGRAELAVTDEDGRPLGTFPADPDGFRSFRLPLGHQESGTTLHFRSPTFVPGGDDTRTLGAAVSRIRLTGRTGARQILAQRFPWLKRDPHDLRFLSDYTVVLANSEYTRGWIQRLWDRDSEVLFPPVGVAGITPAEERADRVVLSAGRYFAPGLGHAKRQLEMVRFFVDGHRRGALAGWRMVVVGGCETSQEPYLHRVRRAAHGAPVSVEANVPRARVRELMSTATVFWSATGYGEDESRRPWTAEHFGMTTAEAMAGGCVPVVIAKAGQREIVRDGIDGFTWQRPEELVSRTVEVGRDESLRRRLAAAAVARAETYSEAAFVQRWRRIAAEHGLLEPARRA